jgi:predicted amidohydrolase
MERSFKAAAVCLDSRPGETGNNLAKMARWTRRAAGEGAALVAFPELSLTGFIPNHPTAEHEPWLRRALRAARSMAEPIEGPAVSELTRIASECRVYVAAGLLEDAGNTLFNTYVLAGPEGVVEAWRKMHVPMFEMPFYNGGGVPRVAATPLGRIGANICFDALLPESTRLLAVQNAEIVLFPFAADPPPRTPAGWSAWAGPAMRARCVENGIFGVACNYAGRVECAGAEQCFPGGAMVIGPRGEVLAGYDGPAGNPGMLIAEISADALTAARAEPEYLFRFRRPELYGSLAR